jgi:hypothetical protein
VTGIRDDADDRESLRFEFWERRRYERDAGCEVGAEKAHGCNLALGVHGDDEQQMTQQTSSGSGIGDSGGVCACTEEMVEVARHAWLYL